MSSGSEAICHFPCNSDLKKEKSVVWFTHEDNIICSQTQLDDIANEQTIICRQLFSGQVVGFRPMKRKKFASNDNNVYFPYLFSCSNTG